MGYFIRKFILALVIVLVILVALLPMWTGVLANHAFEHAHEPWAPDAVRRAVQVRMAIFMYYDAIDYCERAIELFPKSEYAPFFLHAAAVCAEKEDDHKRAVDFANDFLRRFPRHPMALGERERVRRLQPPGAGSKP